MADIIQCPVCGTENPQGNDFCRNCRSPLAATGAETDSIQSGQAPTKRHTAELEPVLPQWLRDARDAARQTEPQSGEESMPQTDKTKPIASQQDLLAGLQSQADSDEEEEVPDWLANITGAQPKPSKEEKTEVSGARWVEMGVREDFPQAEPEEESGMPAWLAGLQSSQPQPEKDELTDWLRSESQPQKTKPIPPPAYETSIPSIPADETPDWLRQMAGEAEEKLEEPKPADLPADTPDWLRGLGSAQEKPQGGESALFFESGLGTSEAPTLPPTDMPDWLKTPAEEEKPAQDTTPKWLRGEPGGTAEPETPAWLASEETVHLSTEGEPAQDDFIADLPDWLKAAAPQSSIFDQPAEQPKPETPAETPDWLKPFQAETPQYEATPEPSETPFENAPAFTPDFKTGESDLFAEMPDWLSNAVEPSSAPAPTPITNEDALAPSDLPAWVQAMRPVEPGGIPSQPSFTSDQTLESRGALAGLQGVLPAAPGFAPTSKPKSYSLKLQTSDEQVAHAKILEQILAAETSPVPLESLPSLGASRGLRWFLTIVMTIAVFAAFLLQPQFFAAPRLVPNEVLSVQSWLAELPIPQNAPVLVAFDYEPSRAAEIETAATPMLDMLILFRHPAFTFVATNETGSMLAERLIAQPTFAEHFKNGGFTYSNLGYLPGGQMGIRAFARDLPGFAAIILITDDAEAARAWIEQTQAIRSAVPVPFIVVSSAQSAPMIEPYYDSGQVTGIVPGLYGGALFEQYNAGRPGTARSYWPPFSLGMLLAALLMLGGGLWNLALGLRDRAAAKGGK